VAEWAGLTELRPAVWPASRSPRRWWKNLSHLPDVPRKGVRSLILLVIWEVWKERNDRVFNRRERSLFVWLISHQPAVFSSQNKPATSNQPAVLFSQNKPPATSQTNMLLLAKIKSEASTWMAAGAKDLALLFATL
jgi:hypothetical protein